MISHQAILDSCRNVASMVREHNPDCPKLGSLLTEIPAQASDEVTNRLSALLARAAPHVPSRDLSALATEFDDWPVGEWMANVPADQTGAVWQSVGMMQMLMQTMAMMPAEMRTQVESVSSSLMGMLGGGGPSGGPGGGLDGLGALVQRLIGGGDEDDDVLGELPRPKRKKKKKKPPAARDPVDRVNAFRDKLC